MPNGELDGCFGLLAMGHYCTAGPLQVKGLAGLAREALDISKFSGDSVSDTESLRRILATRKTIAVVGLSADWFRPSYFASKYMLDHGYQIIPVNPKYKEILGIPCVASLLDIKVPVDMVDVFRRTEQVLPFAEQAVSIGAKCLWQQLGVNNREAHDLVVSAGLESVVDRCVKIEHARLFGGLNWIGVDTGVISAKRQRHS